MDFILWLLLAIAYIVVLTVFGLATWNKGHIVLFFVGFFLPILWIVGALLKPTNSAGAADARARLRGS